MTGANSGGIQSLMIDYLNKLDLDGNFSNIENIFVFAFSGGTLLEKFNNGLNKVYTCDETKNIFSRIIFLYKIIATEKPDIIIEHFSAPVLRFIALTSKIIYGSKVVIYQHHSAWEDAKNKPTIMQIFIKNYNALILNKANGIIAISQFVKNTVVSRYKINPDKIKVVYNGTNCYDRVQSMQVKENKPMKRLIFVGRVVHEKGIHKIIQAMKFLDTSYTLTIVGSGPYMENLKKIVAELELSNVVFLGNRNDIHDLLEDADIFIHVPECQEGFGITVIEAMAAGVTCLVNDHGALPEIVINGKNGYIINDAPEKIADFIRDLKYNDEIIQEGLQTARSFSIEKYVANFMGYIKNL